MFRCITVVTFSCSLLYDIYKLPFYLYAKYTVYMINLRIVRLCTIGAHDLGAPVIDAIKIILRILTRSRLQEAQRPLVSVYLLRQRKAPLVLSRSAPETPETGTV